MMFTMMAIKRQLLMGNEQGVDPGAVVKAACLKIYSLEKRRSRVRPPPPAGIQVAKK